MSEQLPSREEAAAAVEVLETVESVFDAFVPVLAAFADGRLVELPPWDELVVSDD